MGKITTESIRAMVRPILTIGFSGAFITGCVMGAIDSNYLVYATLGMLAFWFGERYFGNLANIVNNHNQASPTLVAEPEVVLPSSPPPAAPPPVTVVEAPPEPLDIEAFHAQVLADVQPNLKATNPATIFYEATTKGSLTHCANIGQALDYWDYMVTLAYAAEAYVKEQTETKAEAAGGCKGVIDPTYAKIQQDLQTTIRNRDFVSSLARTDIDWRKALANNDDLYRVGALAEQVIRASWETK